MIDPKRITPLLTNMTVDRELGQGPNGTVYLVTRRMDMRKLALKHIAIPASDDQTKALIYAGAVKNEAEAQKYYAALVKDVKTELLQFNSIHHFSHTSLHSHLISLTTLVSLASPSSSSCKNWTLGHTKKQKKRLQRSEWHD